MKTKQQLIDAALRAIENIKLGETKSLSIRQKYIRKDQKISLARALNTDYVSKKQTKKKEPK